MNDGRKRKPQKHQNKTAFKVLFDPQAENVHKKVTLRGYVMPYSVSANDAPTNSPGNYSSTSTKK
jgi:hypothetical protein